MMNTTTPANTFAAVELEMDMEVKSEPESEDDTMNCSISVTSSVEEVLKPEHSQSDEEELEDEPLVEIESVMVPQELVKDELEPNLLLFVKKDPVRPDSAKSTAYSSTCLEKPLYSKDDKYTQTFTVSELSITKALRNIKRKQESNFHSSSEQNDKRTKYKMKVPKRKTLGPRSSKDDSKASSPPNGCRYLGNESLRKGKLITNSEVEHGLSTKLRKRNSKVSSKQAVVKEKKSNKLNNRRKLKSHNSSEEILQVNNVLEKESSANPWSNELHFSNKSYSKEETEKETYHFVRELKGKENTQCNNEDDNTADSVLSGDNRELNEAEENQTGRNVKEVSKPNSYDCTICGKQFREKSHLATHARAHNDIRNFKCNECGLLFKTKTNLYYHMKTHEAPFTCLKCNKTFLQKKMFTRHLRVVHSGEGLYNCDICARSFKSAHNLELHYTLHTGNKPFSCDVCRKSFVYKSTYRAHMKAHEADEQFDCEVCLAAGPQDKGELRRRCHHYSQARPWLCTMCGKGYPLKATLKNHMKSHEAEKPFKCKECGKYFMKRQTYECHLKTHSGEQPQYMCDQCSQSYFSFVSLKRHYMKHTGERKFTCDMCSKAFWTKDAMKVHRRSHENMKTFQCTQCSKAFAHKHTLVAHSRTHSGEPLHSCDVCCKTFLHKYHLTRHLRQHSQSFLPPPLPLTSSLYMLPPHNHLDLPTLQIL